MAIREDLVASAVQFLHDPSVAASSIENRISFLRSKNLTQEEIDAALARAGGGNAPAPSAPYPSGPSGPPQPYYQPYPQYAWQPPPAAPRRDWRDWFIMATVVGGVSYGLYSLGKRYVYPLVAPPTPERLEQDKKSIEEQFDKAFALVEQLSKDTEALKEAEKQRTERLDTTLSELEAVMVELKAANRRREDDAQRIRDEVQGLKDAIPKAMNNQKDLTDKRLGEINTELASLKTLVSQRMNSSASTTNDAIATTMRGINGNANANANASSTGKSTTSASESTNEGSSSPVAEAPKSLAQSSYNRLPRSSISSGAKASIPAWQMAMANKTAGASAASPSSPSSTNAADTAAEGNSGGGQKATANSS